MNIAVPWVLWLLIMMVFLLPNRNPIYLIICLLALFGLGAFLVKKKQKSFWLSQNVRFLLTMVLISTIINTFFTHTGSTILFQLPENWLLIGGKITVESMVYGAINGLVIASLYLVFNIINLALSVKQLTRLIPVAFHPVAMIVTIALTFFPSIQQRTREIKEAQMIRGNPMKKISDWVPLMIPLLVTSLEKAILLSESMTSRGFIAQHGSKSTRLMIIALVIAVFTVFSGWIFQLYDYPNALSTIFYILGGLIVFWVFFISSRQTKVTRFHQDIWLPSDIYATIIFSLLLVGLLISRITYQQPILSYTPYPILSLPPLHLSGFLLCFIPVLPLFFSSHD